MSNENMNSGKTKFFNDPKFSAYALGELSANEKEEYLKTLKENGVSQKEIDEEVAQINKLSTHVKNEFEKDDNLRVSAETREEILNQIGPKGFMPKWLIAALSFGAVSTLGVVVFMNSDNSLKERTTLIKTHQGKKKQVKPMVSDLMENKEIVSSRVGSQRGIKAKGSGYYTSGANGDYENINTSLPAPSPNEMRNREQYDKIDANPYTLVANQPLSTLSVDVDTASYANMRRFLFGAKLPPKDSIRVEEVINYFHYDYDFSHSEHPVAIKVDQSNSPWNEKRKLVRVALKADAKDRLTSADKNLVFLLDVSGSMNSPKKLPLLKESMKLLLRKLKDTDTISLVVYAGAAGVVLRPTPVSDKIEILKALDKLSAGGSTNGAAGIQAAYDMAKIGYKHDGVNRVLLATDGDFNVGQSSQSDLITMIEKKAKENIFLTVVGLGMGNYQDSMLEKISNRGNGNYAYIDSLSEAKKLFQIDLEKNLTTVAKDVKLQIEFNPKAVAAYRLIGYENRMLAAQDFNDDKKDAAEMGAGHTVTALYEIALVGENMNLPKIDKLKYATGSSVKGGFSSDLLTVKMRYKKPNESTSKKLEVVLKKDDSKFKNKSEDFRFAVSAASFALKLRDDKIVESQSFEEIEKMAKGAQGKDQFGFREEFFEMIDLAKKLKK